MSLSFYVQKIEPSGISFSYGGFSGFRHRIARSIGLKDVYPGIDTDMYATGRYKEIESDHPMFPLIDHDDNDGKLEPDDCGQVGAYLKILIPEWEKEFEENHNGDLGDDIEDGKKLADLMLRCYENDETLLFI